MDGHDHDTVECGFRQRLLRHLPVPDPEFLAKFKEFCHDQIPRLFNVVRPLEFEEWLDSTTYNDQRKQQLRTAHDLLRGGRPTSRQASHVDTHVKTEFYLEYKHCRMINSRCDAFKAWSGPMFKAIEREVYQHPWFIKHTPVPERPGKIQQLKKAGRYYYSTDFTAYESHFTPEFMNMCECELYRHCLSQHREDADFLCKTISGTNRMRTRSGVSAQVQGRRMSGDMCTSLGNGFTNFMLAQFMAHIHGGRIEGFVEGDDGLFATDFIMDAADYQRLGFTIKMERIDDPCEASFCGMVCTEDNQIIKDPRKFFMGFGWTHSFIGAGPRIMYGLLRAKAMSALYETPSCPIIGVLARRAYDLTAEHDPIFVDDGYHKPVFVDHAPKFDPTPATRELFFKMYGITIDEQLLAERLIMEDRLDQLQQIIRPAPHQADYSARYIEVT